MDWATGLADFPTLETERLILRRPRIDDAEDLFEVTSDSQVTRTVTIETHQSLDDTHALLERIISRVPAESGRATWAVVLKENGKVVGTCGIFLDSDKAARAEAAYMLGRQYWGRGLITEALKAVLDFGFGTLGLNRIEALCMLDNPASARVMEKAGMQYEGILREYTPIHGVYEDVKCYAILRREWAERQA